MEQRFDEPSTSSSPSPHQQAPLFVDDDKLAAENVNIDQTDNETAATTTNAFKCNHDKTDNQFVGASEEMIALMQLHGTFVQSLIESNQIQKLYDTMKHLKYNFNVDTLKNHLCCIHCFCENKIQKDVKINMTYILPEKHRLPAHPNEFKPVQHIQDFLDREGDVVWEIINSEDYYRLYAYMSYEIEDLQHPLTGNTIFHENTTIQFIFKNYSSEKLSKLNWYGDRVLSPNLIDLIKVKNLFK